MQDTPKSVLLDIAHRFSIAGNLLSIDDYNPGHINQTYLSTWAIDGSTSRFIHQRINDQVFKNVSGLMGNIQVITEHINGRLKAGKGEPGERCLSLVFTNEGRSYFNGDQIGSWRTYKYLSGTETHNICPGPEFAYEAARSLGRFVMHLADFPVASLTDPIPNFQNSLFRFEGLAEAVKFDLAGRAGSSAAEIDFALSNKDQSCAIVSAFKMGQIPMRVTHADPKVNNVLFDCETKKGVGVVDLDTCMAGTVLYDFGDLVRSASVAAAEDERDLSKVKMDSRYFEALVKGYLEKMKQILTPAEVDMLYLAPYCIAITLGVRFLADHLNGDKYFRIERENQNLDRARVQFQIAKSMAEQSQWMSGVVKEAMV